MKKNKKLLIQPALLAAALVTAGLITPPPALALTLKPLDGGAKKHAPAPTNTPARPTAARPAPATRPVAAHPVAARPGTFRPTPAALKKPLARPGSASGAKQAAAAKSPAAAARKPALAAKSHAGGQLLVIMRSGTKLTPPLLANLSQAAHSRLSPVQYYGSGEYILRAQGVSNLPGLKTAAARLRRNANILRAYAYKKEKPLYLKVQANKNYILVDPYLNHRTAAGVPSALTLMPKQIIGVRVPLRMVRAASRALKRNTTLPTGMLATGFLAAVPGASLYNLATQHPSPKQSLGYNYPMVYNYPEISSVPIPVALNEADMPSTLGISKGSWNLISTGMVNFPATITWGAGKSSGTKAVSNTSDTSPVPVDAPTKAIIRDVPLLDPNDPTLADQPDNLVTIPPGLTNPHFPTIDFKSPASSTSSGTPQAVIAPDPLPIIQFPPEALGYAPNSDPIISWPQIPTGTAPDPMPVVTFPPSLLGGTPGSTPGSTQDAGQPPGQATPPDNSFGLGLPQPGDGSTPSPSSGSAPDPGPSSGSSPTAAAPGTPPDPNASSGGTDTPAPPPDASAGTPPAAPGIATGVDQGVAPDPSATPPADLSGGGMMGGPLGTAMGISSVRSARRAAAITPAEKSLIAHWATYMYAIKQNAIIGYHVPTIDSAGVAHGRDIYLQVMKPHTAAPAKTAARKPLAKAPAGHQPAPPAAKPATTKPAPAAPKPAAGSIFGGHGSLIGG